MKAVAAVGEVAVSISSRNVLGGQCNRVMQCLMRACFRSAQGLLEVGEGGLDR